MASLSVLIFGGDSWIGKKVVNILERRCIHYQLAKCRGDDIETVREEIREYTHKYNREITHIMSLIYNSQGYYEGTKTGPLKYEEDPIKLQENMCDNFFIPMQLANLCKEMDIHFTYLGSGCIFSYKDRPRLDNIFGETDLPNFFGSSYSIVKGYTDRLMHLFDNTTLNVRIRLPVSDEDCEDNYLMKVIKYEKIYSLPNSITVLNDVLPIMVQLALIGTTGTINLTNPGVITHTEILTLYKEIVDPTYTWQKMNETEYNTLVKPKRAANYIDTKKLEIITDNNIRHIHESIIHIFFKMREQKEKEKEKEKEKKTIVPSITISELEMSNKSIKEEIRRELEEAKANAKLIKAKMKATKIAEKEKINAEKKEAKQKAKEEKEANKKASQLAKQKVK